MDERDKNTITLHASIAVQFTNTKVIDSLSDECNLCDQSGIRVKF